MLIQVVTNQDGQQRENRYEVADTSRIREFLRMNPPSFTGSIITEDPENFIEELQKVLKVMHIVDAKRVELAAYQLKGRQGFKAFTVPQSHDLHRDLWSRPRIVRGLVVMPWILERHEKLWRLHPNVSRAPPRAVVPLTSRTSGSGP
uniref:Gag-pol polyprotein n=1 Tax=Solanum tuberosum TaxID=4113 RepID=M1D9J5_SOLTU